MTRPDPARISVLYDADVDGAAEVLIAILAKPPDVDPETESRATGEETGDATE